MTLRSLAKVSCVGVGSPYQPPPPPPSKSSFLVSFSFTPFSSKRKGECVYSTGGGGRTFQETGTSTQSKTAPHPESAFVNASSMVPSTLNPQPSTLNPRPETRELRLESRDPRPETRDPRPETRDPRPETRNPIPKTRYPEPGTRNPKPETRNPKPETSNPKSETRKQGGGYDVRTMLEEARGDRGEVQGSGFRVLAWTPHISLSDC